MSKQLFLTALISLNVSMGFANLEQDIVSVQAYAKQHPNLTLFLGVAHSEDRFEERFSTFESRQHGCVFMDREQPERTSQLGAALSVDFNNLDHLKMLSNGLSSMFSKIVFDYSVVKFTDWNSEHLKLLGQLLTPEGHMMYPLGFDHMGIAYQKGEFDNLEFGENENAKDTLIRVVKEQYNEGCLDQTSGFSKLKRTFYWPANYLCPELPSEIDVTPIYDGYMQAVREATDLNTGMVDEDLFYKRVRDLVKCKTYYDYEEFAEDDCLMELLRQDIAVKHALDEFVESGYIAEKQCEVLRTAFHSVEQTVTTFEYVSRIGDIGEALFAKCSSPKNQ